MSFVIKSKIIKKNFFYFLIAILLVYLAGSFYHHTIRYFNENKVLKEVVKRLQASSRIADVLVTGVRQDKNSGKRITTIKFLEFNTNNRPLEPRYFEFPGNIIQFQSLVVRFADIHIRKKSLFRDKSAYFFWKVFMLDGQNTVEYEITNIDKVPQGYKIRGGKNRFEEKIWEKFWEYARDPKKAEQVGIKNAQIEAPGTKFIPGILYRLEIEHDGGIHIGVYPLPQILKGEMIP